MKSAKHIETSDGSHTSKNNYKKSTELSSQNENKIEIRTNNITYIIETIIGKGTFGIVYKASLKNSPTTKFAIKRYFRNINPDLCQKEISIISYLNKRTNLKSILRIYDGFFYQDDLYFVTPYIQHNKFSSIYQSISWDDLKNYLRSLLQSLKAIHGLGIVHRDVKPDNFLYNIHTKNAQWIDFGLAEADWNSKQWMDINHDSTDNDYLTIEELQRKSYKHNMGTRGFTAPEIIFKGNDQSSAVDIYAAGAIFACFASKRYPLFNFYNSNWIQDKYLQDIEPLVVLHGREKVCSVAKKHKASLYVSEVFNNYQNENGIRVFVQRSDWGEEGVDLWKKMLDIDANTRITAVEALEHPFWKE